MQTQTNKNGIFSNRIMTIEEVWAVLQETALGLKELKESQKETDRQMKETDKRISELGNCFDELVKHLMALNTMNKFNPNGYTSMCQDVLAGRKTEVEMFSLTLMELAKKHGIPVPVNEMLYLELKTIEAGYLRAKN